LTANSGAKLALGIADNQALTVLCECVATVRMIIFPREASSAARSQVSSSGSTLRSTPVSTASSAKSGVWTWKNDPC